MRLVSAGRTNLLAAEAVAAALALDASVRVTTESPLLRDAAGPSASTSR